LPKGLINTGLEANYLGQALKNEKYAAHPSKCGNIIIKSVVLLLYYLLREGD
jgi:hypothetical protein